MKIIGVTSDFHVKSLHNKIAPALMMLRSDFVLIAARYLPNSEKNVIADFSSKYKEVFPGTDFEYRFLSEQYDQVYSTEERAGKLILLFTALALFISCLGLFGLVTFIASQRVKEIGIRKVLGASVQSIVNLLSLEFLKWVLAANLIAIPVSYYFMRNWLQNFAYRVEIDYWIFAVSALLAIIISFIVLSFQTIKTAFANPVESLRQE
jgi:putative ABC transport system permease protein